MLELKSRLEVVDSDLEVVGARGSSGAGAGGPRFEVRAALAGLGYGAEEIREVVRALPEEGSVEELLRNALRRLAASR